MNAPYRTGDHPPVYPAALDPVREAQAEVLREIAAGLRVANEKLKRETSSIASSAYEQTLKALESLHDAVIRGGGRS